MSPAPAEVLRTAARVLALRAGRDELLALGSRHLAFGLVWTWLVGVGRYWDNPKASLPQLLGVGSLAYVFVLSGFLWLVIRPLRPEAWSYRRLLTFVTLTSPPALLYAIPVERWTSLATARQINVWFLAAVAAWRVALLVFFLARVARLVWYEIVVAAVLPPSCVVVALTMLNLEHVVFGMMAGLRDESPNAGAYEVLVGISLLSSLAFPVLLLAYLVLVATRRRRLGPRREPERSTA